MLGYSPKEKGIRVIKIGLNGFGRIGRALTRQILSSENLQLVAVNDLESDLGNLAYLLEFDSVYGTFSEKVKIDGNKMLIRNKEINFYSCKKIGEVPWDKNNVDILIEATGSSENVTNSRYLIESNMVKKVLVTNNDKNVDLTVIMSVNESDYNPQKHSIISGSICDANAIAPALKILCDNFKLESVFVTTLHPWLNYQNLLDSTVSSISNPGHNWKDYSLGRSSIGNLIIKETTAAEATITVIPELDGKMEAVSFRVPTNNVAVSDISIFLNEEVEITDVYEIFEDAENLWPDIFMLNQLSLVSSDFSKLTQSCIIEKRFIKLINKKHLKLIIWYDNEWAFCKRILDICYYIDSKESL